MDDAAGLDDDDHFGGCADTRTEKRPRLAVCTLAGQETPVGVIVCLKPDLVSTLRGSVHGSGLLEALLQISVVQAEDFYNDDLPGIFGRYEVLENGLRFIPHFPFEAGLAYQARFDPRPLGRTELLEVLTLQFSLPEAPSGPASRVQEIYPSSDSLPENLLRFYVHFCNSMQRGRVEAEITILQSDGRAAPDVLYRAPVELWDRTMHRLTILLDPGRLKRGLGPNRALGPPLTVGEVYTLAIGAGMLDLHGAPLTETVYKRFCVTEAVREHVAIEGWKILSPPALSREPLVLQFERPLDFALLLDTIVITSPEGRSVAGDIVIDQMETRWNFTPTSPWAAGPYQVQVASSLEDVCGNSMITAFDRPFRPGSSLTLEAGTRTMVFHVG